MVALQLHRRKYTEVLHTINGKVHLGQAGITGILRCIAIGLVFLFLPIIRIEAQVAGDYRTNATGTWNWNVVGNWQRYDGSAWVAAADFPGQNPGAGTVTIQNNTNVILNITPANPIGALTISGGANNSSVQFAGANGLVVSGTVTLNGPSNNNRNKYLLVDNGSLTSASIAMTDGGGDTRDCYISIGNGSVEVSGDVTMAGSNVRNYFLFNGSGTLYVGGAMTGGGITSTPGGSAGPPTSGTVNFNGTGNQTLTAYNYYNLAISGNRTSNNVTLVNGTIGVAGAFVPSASFSTGGYIVAGNTMNFNGTGSQTIPAFNYNNLTISGARTVNSVTFDNTGTIGVAGIFNPSATFTSGGWITAGSTIDFNGTGNQTIPAFNYYNLTISGNRGANNVTLVNGGTIGISGTFLPAAVFTSGGYVVTNNTINFNGSGSQTIPAFNYNNLTVSGARTVNSVTFDNTGTIGVAGTFNPSATFTTGGWVVAGSTIDFNGDANQMIPAFSYYNLSVSNKNAASVTARTKTLGGTVSVEGDVTVTGLGPTPRVTLVLAGQNFTVNGQTIINSYGILNDASAAGTNIFNGQVIINTDGSWTTSNNPPFVFRNGLVYNGSQFAGGTGTYTFEANNQAIAGSIPFTITNVVVNGITLTNVNTGGLTVGTFTGSGNLTNGDATHNVTLFLAGADPIQLTGGVDFTSWPNTVNYSSGGAQTIGAYDFYNLTSSRTGSRTLINGGTIRIANVFNKGTNAYINTGNTVEFNGTADQQIPAFTFNNLILSGGSTKVLTGAVTVNNVLTLNGAILELDNYNLTMVSNLANAIQGTFDGSNMISTNGTGYLVKNAASAQALYPIGSGGYYSPVTVSAVVPNTGVLRIRAVPLAINASYIKKYWDITTSVARTSVTATFQYDPAEENAAAQAVNYSPDGGNTWQSPPATGSVSFGSYSFTVTGTSPFAGWWTMGYRTLYSYQNGNWDNPTTWTTDPSGTLQVGNTIPGTNDRVVILTGRTVTLTADVAVVGLDITIDDGGFLDMATYRFVNPPAALRGQGTLRLASVNFPAAVVNTFVNSGGGTTEYYNASDFNLPLAQTTYNNLSINAPGVVATQLNNLTLNGNLWVKQGTYRINDNTAARRQLIINGSVRVEAGASIGVGNGVTNTTTDPYNINGGVAPFLTYYDGNSHRVVVYGDFYNAGTVRFTNLNYPVYNAFPPTTLGATTGFATVYFMGASSNTLTCEGTTDFYNLVVDKGTDQTYKLTVNSEEYEYFRIFGANTAGGSTTNPVATAANPNLRKALWIRNGTLELTGRVIIPSLSEGTCGDGATPNSDFYIPANAALVLNGPNVVVLSTADDYQEVNVAYNLSGGTGLVNGVGLSGCSSVSILGKLQINAGYFSTRESGGFITWDYASGELQINGGNVDAKQFRAAGGAGGLASFVQTGGTFELRGRFQRTPSAYTSVSDLTNAPVNTNRIDAPLDGSKGTFNLNAAANVLTLSGGTVRIFDVCGASNRVVEINSAQGNYAVTGGTFELMPMAGTGLADAPAHIISSTAPFYNLTINRASSAATISLNNYPLTVLNNLNLVSGALVANNFNIAIGGNFLVLNGTTYTPGLNWTIFNGTSNQQFQINTGSAFSVKKLRVDKPAGTLLALVGSQLTLNAYDSVIINNCTLHDGGKSLVIGPSTTSTTSYLYNSGIHTGTGKIVLADDDPQIIDGDGNGVFGNLELNNTDALAAPVSLANNVTINGTLTFSQNKLLNIGSWNLKFSSSASIVNAGPTRYIQTAGNLGDRGITRVFSSSAPSFVFPLGAASVNHAAPDYTPATISITGTPASYGSITVVPAGYEHPATTTKNRSLTYFWNVTSSGFNLGSATVTHAYLYSQSDVVTGAGITEDGYVAARYDPATALWTRGVASDVDETANQIGEPCSGSFLENVAFIDGHYTAGDDDPVNPFGTPTKYYSRQSGLWGNVNTWSTVSHTGPPAGTVPGAGDIVIIGGNDSVYLSTNNTTPNTDVRSCASLQIEAGSALDIGYNPGCNFRMVLSHPNGNGNFRLTTSWTSGSTFTFPSGDFSQFNVNLGTTELYSTNPAAGTTYYLPNGITSYGNLILSPLGGSNIIFPNNDLTIYGNLITRGQNADSWFCPTWNVNYPTPPAVRISKTITIRGNLDIQGGALVWFSDGALAQNFVIYGNVIVHPGAAIDVYSNSTNNTMSIGGSLINNSDGAHGGVGTVSRVRFLNGANFCDVVFFGSNNASVTNTDGNPTTIFRKVTINKGTSQATTLTIDIGGTLTTPVNGWLTLQNGTLRYMRTNPATDFTISTTSPFTIPSTAGLYIDYSNANNRNVLIANAANNANDVYLSGKLTVVQGNVYIGPTNGTTANNNDIEYSGSGSASIEVRGGRLVVNGQIRRNASSTAGVLSYVQTGGDVVINGQAALATRAKLEVLNTGSVFNMSGGRLTIVRGGGTTYGDLYLRPASSSVTGGEIVFTQVPSIGPVVDAAQNYSLESNCELNHLTITGKTAATARSATVTLMVSPLTVRGNLTLTNGQSFLNSNNKDITIRGDLINNGTYTYGTNKTIFDGVNQSVSGTSVTNFYDLTASPTSTLTVNRSFTVNRNLVIESGSLVLGTNKLTLLGNLTVDGSYTDDNTNGEILLQGTSQQQISGNGQFGRLELNNALGARLLSSISLQGNLVLTSGILDIGSWQLTLGSGSDIAGSYSSTRMIRCDGVLSSGGIKKLFPVIGSSRVFTYPFGVSGKYTPAVFTIDNNAATGFVTVKPVNSKHPAVLKPDSVLQYYWSIESSGIADFRGNVVLSYNIADVAGTESEYVAARLFPATNSWSKASPGSATDNVDEALHTITFYYPAGNNDVTGDYTAGTPDAIPDDVPVYHSVKTGNWNDETVWEPVGSFPPCPAGGPNGFIVVIDSNVTANVNYCYAYRTFINGKLSISPSTFGHNLGIVDGEGTLHLESPNLPAGNFNAFFDCNGNGTLEFGGTSSYTIVTGSFSSFPNLFFTGTGTRILPSKNLTVCHRLVINGPLLENSVNNRRLTILGTMELYGGGAFNAGSGANAVVSFAGSAPQFLGGTLGNFSGSNRFNILEINNPNGLTINASSVIHTNYLYLTNGVIKAGSGATFSVLSTSSLAVTPVGGSSSSYVDGPLTKLIPAGGSFQFPLGKEGLYAHPFTVTSAESSTYYWTAEFFTPNSTATSVNSPLAEVNPTEFWTLRSTGNYQARIKIGWDASSDLNPQMTQNGLVDMRVAEYNTGISQWDEIASTATGTLLNGSVETSASVAVPVTGKNFTTATVTSTKPIAALNPAGAVCAGTGIPIRITTYSPISFYYELDYTIEGVPQPTVQISSLPYTLPAPVAGVYALTAFRYNNGTLDGIVNATPVTVYDLPPAANAGADQSLCGASGTTLNGNNPAPYSGLWTIVSGAGGNVITPTQYNSAFTGIAGNTYILRWTISNGGCQTSDDVVIGFPVAPSKPLPFISAQNPVCQGAVNQVYTVPNEPGVTYNWTYSGSDVTIHGSGNSVSLDFGLSATSGNLSVTATNACGTSEPRTVTITVNTLPVAFLSSDDPDNSFCYGTNVTFTATAGYATYQFRVDGNVQQSGSSNTFTTAALTDGQSVDALVITAQGCSSVTNAIVNTVHPNPVVTLLSDDPDQIICSGTTVNFTATGGYNTYDFRINGSTVQSGASSTFATSGLLNGQQVDVLVSSADGCSTLSNPLVFTVHDAPVASAANNGPVCEGQTLTLTGGPVGMASYSWSGPNGFTSSLQNPVVSVTALQTMSGIYVLTITDTNGCQDTEQTSVTVNPAPQTDTIYRNPNQ
jgi:hypothetical protein